MSILLVQIKKLLGTEGGSAMASANYLPSRWGSLPRKNTKQRSSV